MFLTAFDRNQYKSLLTSAGKDRMHIAILNLAFQLDVGSDGWTIGSYSDSDLLTAMGYASNKRTRDDLKRIRDTLKEQGILDWHPPSGHHRRYYFSYLRCQQADPSQLHFLSKVDDKMSKVNDNLSQGLFDQQQMASLADAFLTPDNLSPAYDKLSQASDKMSQQNGQFPPHDSNDDSLSLSLDTGLNHQQNHEPFAITDVDVLSQVQRITADWVLEKVGTDRNVRDRYRDVAMQHPDAFRLAGLNTIAGTLIKRANEGAGVSNPGAYFGRIKKDLTPYYQPAVNYLQTLANTEPWRFEPDISRDDWDTFEIMHMSSRLAASDKSNRFVAYAEAKQKYPDNFVARGIAYVLIAHDAKTTEPKSEPGRLKQLKSAKLETTLPGFEDGSTRLSTTFIAGVVMDELVKADETLQQWQVKYDYIRSGKWIIRASAVHVEDALARLQREETQKRMNAIAKQYKLGKVNPQILVEPIEPVAEIVVRNLINANENLQKWRVEFAGDKSGKWILRAIKDCVEDTLEWLGSEEAAKQIADIAKLNNLGTVKPTFEVNPIIVRRPLAG